jgi:bacterioferritin
MLSRSHSEYVEGQSVIDMIREDLIAELAVIESYHELANHFGDADPDTRQLLEGLLSAGEAHLDGLATLLEAFSRRP